jgi:hypothetical protein
MTDRMKHSLTLLWVAALAVGWPAAAADGKKALPEGWFVTESAPQLYEAGLDSESPCEGNRSALLRSRQATTEGYGTFMQAFGAGAFRGKRLRFSAMVRTEDVQGWTGLWMRVEGEDPKVPLAFDNMQSRALVGSTPCKRYDVVLDVPQEAKAIMAGLMLSGTGKAWMGSVRFETVDASVPVTNLIADRPAPRADRPTGRIGGVWFNRGQVEGESYRALLQPDGSWKDNFENTLSLVDGNTVQGTLRKQPVRLTVKAGGPSTIIEGQVGKEPVYIELGASKLVMKQGIYTRDLVREDERPEDRSCIRYRTGEGIHVSDFIDVCGEALSKKPPLVPLVLSFLQNGFRTVTASKTVTPRIAPPDRLAAPQVPQPR